MPTTSHKVTVNAAQQKVFTALSTVEGLKGWYTPKIDQDQEAVFSFTGKEPFRWKFIAVEPNTLIRWKCIEGPGESTRTTVTFAISTKNSHETVVECDHEDWPDGHGAFKTCNTLWGILMGHLKKYSETGLVNPAFE